LILITAKQTNKQTNKISTSSSLPSTYRETAIRKGGYFSSKTMESKKIN
jgi:hypothetical protein